VVRWVNVLVASALVAGCGPATPDVPTDVALVELVEDQEGYDGEVVTVEGVVRTYDSPRHHWIEDVDQHRVELEPQDLVAPHVGDEIRVTGRYSFRDDRGRLIEVDELEVIAEADTAPS
jgi:hypothetical protein